MGPRLCLAAALEVERSEHRRAEAMQVIFHDVVCGARLEVLHRRLVSQPARDHNHRGPGGELLRELQGVARPEGWEGMVRDNNVGNELAQGLDHAVSGLDPAKRAEDVGAADLALRERGVLGVVLDYEDPDRCESRTMASGAWGPR